MQFNLQDYKISSWSFLIAVIGWGIIASFLLLQFFPGVFGQLIGVMFGPFASFLAEHDVIYFLLMQGLYAFYTAIAMGGLDIIFLLMVYLLLNKMTAQNNSWKDILGITLCSSWALWSVQLAIGAIVCILLFWRKGFTPLWLLPPFLSDHLTGSLYMVLWALALVLFGMGFAMTFSRKKGFLAALDIFLTYPFLWILVFTIGMILTWLPAWLIGEKFPAWALLLCGITTHCVLWAGAFIALCNQPGLFEQPSSKNNASVPPKDISAIS